MNELSSFFAYVFDKDFMPHGHCYLWKSEVLWLNVGADFLIAMSYFLIPIGLIYFFFQRKDFPVSKIILMFSLFILLCGLTHAVEILCVWKPYYFMQGIVKMLTALVSMYTTYLLFPFIPAALNLLNTENTLQELKNSNLKLEQKNYELDMLNKLFIGREKRILELKKEIADLCKKYGAEHSYKDDIPT